LRLKKNPKTRWSPECGDEFYYAATNGYIDPALILVKQDAVRVQEAIDLLQKFELICIDISPEEEEV
jgi:hypothetical protein